MAILWGKPYTRRELLRRVGDIRQVAMVEPYELVEGGERGVRAVRIHNASGLEMVVVPDRGMALTQLNFQGVPLPFISNVGTLNPAYSEPSGAGWLRTWPGGFSTPCGLTQVGSPCNDGEESLGLHGRVAGIPAREVRWGGTWKEDDYLLWVEGQVTQTAFFGENISLCRRVWTWLGEPRFWIEDGVENHDFKPVPHMFLQHFNLGFPLVDAGSRLILPEHTTVARDQMAEPWVESCFDCEEPRQGFLEQVFYHDLQADTTGQVELRLVNPNFDQGRGLGVYWRYARADYPVLVQWKMMGEGQYVVGIEPANCHVEGRCAERERGSLQVLQPLESRRYTIEVGFFR
jgi:hypothetical protein